MPANGASQTSGLATSAAGCQSSGAVANRPLALGSFARPLPRVVRANRGRRAIGQRQPQPRRRARPDLATAPPFLATIRISLSPALQAIRSARPHRALPSSRRPGPSAPLTKSVYCCRTSTTGDGLPRQLLQVELLAKRDGLARRQRLANRPATRSTCLESACFDGAGRIGLAAEDRRVEPRRRRAGQLPDGIDELLGGQPLGPRAGEDVVRRSSSLRRPPPPGFDRLRTWRSVPASASGRSRCRPDARPDSRAGRRSTARVCIASTGWTMPRPISRCQRRLTIVRVKRPFSGCVISAASCFSRSGCGRPASIWPSSGNSHAACGRLADRLVAAMDLQRLRRSRSPPGRRPRRASSGR